MGTRLHLFVEYDRSRNDPPFSITGNISSLSLAELFVQPDYRLFDALSGGRSFTLRSSEHPPMIAPRGFPKPVSHQVYYRYYHVVEDPSYRDSRYDQISSSIIPLEFVNLHTANQWIEEGSAEFAPIENHSLGRPRRRRISDPNWHSASWLSADELDLSLEFHDIQKEVLQADFLAHLASIYSLRESFGSERTRIVFWFNN